jgi:hypothetical protein
MLLFIQAKPILLECAALMRDECYVGQLGQPQQAVRWHLDGL